MIGKKKYYVKKYSDVSPKEREIVGREADALIKLYNAKVPMPNGFIVTTFAFDDFLLSNKLIEPIVEILGSVRPFVLSSAREASEKISKLILDAKIPKEVEDQIHKMYLEVGNGSYPFVNIEVSNIIEKKYTPVNAPEPKIFDIRGMDATLDAIKQVWLSLFTPDAIELRTNGYYKGELSVAVLIKRSVMSEISGSIYSIPPTTAEPDYFEIQAYYGVENFENDITLYADIYKIDRRKKVIAEKKIIPQKKMRVKNSRSNAKKATIEVEISNEWQKRQKVADEILHKMIDRFEELEAFYNVPLIVRWGIQTGEWFVTDLDEDTNIDSSFQMDRKDLEASKKIKQKNADSIKNKSELEEFEEDIHESLHINENSELTDQVKRIEKEIEFPNPKSNHRKKETVTWQVENRLKQELILNISGLSSKEIHSAEKFNGTYVDGTEFLLKAGKLPEYTDASKESLSELIDGISYDMSVAAKNSNNKPFFYQFSNITQFEYKQLGLQTEETHFVGDERFIENPTSLASEVRALQQMRKEFDGEVGGIIPSLRSTKNVSDILKIIHSQGMQRDESLKMYVEASIPSFVFDIPNLNKGSIDGVIINYDMFLKLSVFREQIRELDHDVVSRTLSPLAKVVRQNDFKLGVLLYDINRITLENILKLKPEFIIFGNIPTEKDIGIIAGA